MKEKYEADMKKKHIIEMIIGIVLLIAAVKGVLIYHDYQSEKKRLAQAPYFTKDKLNESEMNILTGEYHVEVTPSWREPLKKDDWPDYSYYTIGATKDTEVVVTVMNYWMFDDRIEMDQAGWEKAEEYGITTDNRLTVDWVMKNPRKAAEIMDSMANNGDIFRYLKKRIYPVYEEITGIPMEKYQP